MTKSQLCFTSFTVLATLALIPTEPSLAANSPIERSFDVQPGGRLKVASDVGSIVVSTGDVPRVHVAVTVSGPRAEDFKVDFSQSGTEVTVTGTNARRGSWFGSSSNPRVSFDITVPRHFNLDLASAGGPIEISDLDGEVRAETSGGPIELGNIQGRVDVETSGGSITLGNAGADARLKTSGGAIQGGDVAGRLEAETSGGAIQLGKVGGPVDAQSSGGAIQLREVRAAVNAETSGGAIEVSFAAQPAGGSRLSTSGGDVKVYLSDGLGFDLDARGNEVRCDFSIDAETKSLGRLAGKLGGGGPELSLRTSGGDVRVLRR